MEVLHERIDEYAPAQLERVASLIQADELGEKLLPLVRVPQLFLPAYVDEAIAALEAVATEGYLAALARPAELNGFPENSAPALFLSVLASNAAELSEGARSENLEDRVWYNSILKDASTVSERTIAVLAEQVAATGLASRWIAHALDRSTPGGLVQAVAIKLLETPVLYIEDTLVIAKRFADLGTMLGSDGVSTLLTHLRPKEIAVQYAGAEVTKVPSEMIATLGDLPKDTAARDILDLASDLLDNLPNAAWEKALSTPSSQELRLLFALQGIKARPIRSQSFLDAVSLNAIAVLEGKFDPSTAPSAWSGVLEAVDPNSLGQLRTVIEGLFYKAAITPKGAQQFLQHYGSIALKFKFSGSEETADKALLAYYLPLLKAGTETARKYIQDSNAEIKRCLKKASTDARNEYEAAAEQAAKGQGSLQT
jgi:uncharacterized protein YjeT (DUF2065 family)